MSLNRRRLAAIVIVSFWALMTGWLIRRELLIPSVDAGRAAARNEASDTWLGLRLGEQRVGVIHLQQTPERRDGIAGMTMRLRTELAFDMLGKPTALALDGWAWRPIERPGLRFALEASASGSDFAVRGTVADGRLRAEVDAGGERRSLELPVDDQMLLSGGLGTMLTLPNLAVGDSVQLDSFDPLTLRASPTRIRCLRRERLAVGGRTVEASVLEVVSGPLRSQAWVDQDGNVLRAETPFGLTLEALTAEQARAARAAGPANADGGDLLALSAVRPDGLRPRRGARRMVIALGGVEEALVPIDDAQTWTGRGQLSVTARPAGRAEAPASLAPHLAADPFVQADHPRVRARAEAIVGSETDPGRRAGLLHEWVFTHIEKDAVLSVPTALEVLNRRRGDCNEHTVLYAALARAIGLPTRIAIGVVWSDAYEGFYYHAWPEVHVDGWRRLDPTLGQLDADATHIKLLTGGIEQWPRLSSFLGRLQITVLELE